jgi:hypothetical protein
MSARRGYDGKAVGEVRVSSRQYRRRRTISILALTFAASVTMAGSCDDPAAPEMLVHSELQSIHVDTLHSVAYQLVVVTIPDEAAIDVSQAQGDLTIEMPTGTDPSGGRLTSLTAAGVQLAPADATTSISPAPSSGPSASKLSLTSDTIQGPTRFLIPLDCEPGVTCVRAFKVIAVLGSSAVEATVPWHLDLALAWRGNVAPSKSATIRADPPIQIPASAASSDISTEPELITLGASHPVVARLIELDFSPSAPATYVPTGFLEVALAPRNPASVETSAALASVFDVDSFGSSGSMSRRSATDLASGADPFRGCAVGVPCRRRLLITMSWLKGDDPSYAWRLSLHRSDYHRAEESPEATTLKVLGDLETAGLPARRHLEGDAVLTGDGWTTVTATVRVDAKVDQADATAVEKVTSSLDARTWAGLLPIPGSITYSIEPVDADSKLSPFVTNVFVSPGRVEVQLDLQPSPASWSIEPFALCYTGVKCPELVFESGKYPQSVESTARFHWSLDLAVYPYPGIAYDVSMELGPSS